MYNYKGRRVPFVRRYVMFVEEAEKLWESGHSLMIEISELRSGKKRMAITRRPDIDIEFPLRIRGRDVEVLDDSGRWRTIEDDEAISYHAGRVYKRASRRRMY